tara:strand:- start:720 stop:965 length:246 start_codon:yes stop_codon:yes gene_type:complete
MEIPGETVLTPLEIRASEFVSGLAFHASVQELIRQDQETRLARELPEFGELNSAVEHDERIIQATFMVAGLILENGKGISA